MNEEEKSVRSVDRALNIMDCFTREHPRLSLNEISKMLNLSPSTVSRIIATLENRNYLRRDPQSLLYSLGYRLTNLGAICLETSDLREIARPHLVELRDYYNESVGLYVLNKGQRVCADCVQSTQSLRRVIEVGTQKPLTRGASGKLLLAYMEEKDIRQNLLQDPFVTFEELAKIREDGYAASFNEFEQGISSVAVPVFNGEHNVCAALFLSGPMTRISLERVKEMAERMMEVSSEISIKLGCS